MTVSLTVNALDAAAKRPLTYKATGLPPGLAISNQGHQGRAQRRRDVPRDGLGQELSGGNGSVQFTWQVSAAAPGGLGAVTFV